MDEGACPDIAAAYVAAISSLAARFGRRGRVLAWQRGPIRWLSLSPAGTRLATQGWKIHVSMAADEVCAFAQRLLPVLLECEVPFKIAQSVDDIERINSGDAGAAQLGKILTVYPPDEQAARTLILQLDRAWPTTHGPEVQTDLHLRARLAVSFRYGVFGAAPPVLDRMQG